MIFCDSQINRERTPNKIIRDPSQSLMVACSHTCCIRDAKGSSTGCIHTCACCSACSLCSQPAIISHPLVTLPRCLLRCRWLWLYAAWHRNPPSHVPSIKTQSYMRLVTLTVVFSRCFFGCSHSIHTRLLVFVT